MNPTLIASASSRALQLLCLMVSLQPLAGLAADAPAKPVAKTAKAAAPAHAAAHKAAPALSEGQMQASARVLIGDAGCEFNQAISVKAVAGQPGHFHVGFKKAVYTMVPEETTTGAVRLEDKKAGVVWLQIPTKSMLMNAKLGQRMVDACLMPEQHAAVAAAEAAAKAAAEAAAAQSAAAAAASSPAPGAASAASAASAATGGKN